MRGVRTTTFQSRDPIAAKICNSYRGSTDGGMIYRVCFLANGMRKPALSDANATRMVAGIAVRAR